MHHQHARAGAIAKNDARDSVVLQDERVVAIQTYRCPSLQYSSDFRRHFFRSCRHWARVT